MQSLQKYFYLSVVVVVVGEINIYWAHSMSGPVNDFHVENPLEVVLGMCCVILSSQ